MQLHRCVQRLPQIAFLTGYLLMSPALRIPARQPLSRPF